MYCAGVGAVGRSGKSELQRRAGMLRDDTRQGASPSGRSLPRGEAAMRMNVSPYFLSLTDDLPAVLGGTRH